MESTYSTEQAAVLLGDFSRPWWVAGGWAIDLHLGRQTREHEDLDLAVLREDEHALRRYLEGWEVWPGLGQGELESKPIAMNEALSSDRHVLWCRPSAQSDWAFEALVIESASDQWIFRRDDRVRRPLSEIGSTAGNGIAYLRPEIVLLFKAKNNLDKDQHDFAYALPALSEDAKEWLTHSLRAVHPGHPWLANL